MNPILRDFPDHLTTERLAIRAPRPGDGEALNAAVRESWEDLQPWMPWARGEPPSLADSEQTVREAYSRFIRREELWLFLFHKEGDVLVGSSGLHRINWDVPRFEIGYWVRSGYGGQGFITEAVRGITSFAFSVLGAHRVEIRCDARNERSAAVARRAGYPLEAVLHNDDRHHTTGELRDTLIFAQTRPDD
jgi:RimJ/RimL family protein N-acetyltransferase